MTDEIRLTPFAPALLMSMRAIGYSFESAVADILDNSISAEARNIWVDFSPLDGAWVAISDDGWGMDEGSLNEAMRHGSQDPSVIRATNDLGRFGLGLKTASLSQCRQLTVISKREGLITCRQWDLDIIAARKDWILRCPRSEEFLDLPAVQELCKRSSGTVVLWRNLDRLLAGERSAESALGEKADQCREHLGLVFHRLMASEGSGLRIFLNGNPVEPADPFLTTHPQTQVQPMEVVVCEGASIEVVPYVLPHASKLKPRDVRKAGTGEFGFRRGQGLYIYRNKRLIIWGTWFRMASQEELTKLARVRVDIPNSLDHLWTLDVKKSTAYPPDVVRAVMKRILGRISESSRRVYTYRGRRTNTEVEYAWERLETRDGYSYSINRKHPLIATLLTKLDPMGAAHFSEVLAFLEQSFPSQAMYADMAGDVKIEPPQMPSEVIARLTHLGRLIVEATGGPDSEAGKRFLSRLDEVEPFSMHRDELETVRREILRGA